MLLCKLAEVLLHSKTVHHHSRDSSNVPSPLQIISGNPTCNFLALALPDLPCGICVNSLFALQIWRNCYLCLSFRLSSFYFHSASMCFLLEMKWWVERWRLPDIVYLHLFDMHNTQKASRLISGPKPAPSCKKALVHAHVQMPTLCPCTLPGWKEERGRRKKAHSLIVHWTNFSFDDSMRSLWHCFYKPMQCHSIYFHPELHSCFAKLLCWRWGSWTTA